MRELEMLSTVALLEDVAAPSLRRGQVGTVVERLAPGVYEVEFSDDEGRTYTSWRFGPTSFCNCIINRAIRRLDHSGLDFKEGVPDLSKLI